MNGLHSLWRLQNRLKTKTVRSASPPIDAILIADCQGKAWPLNGMAIVWRDHFGAQPNFDRIWREDEKFKTKLKQLFSEHVWERVSTPRLKFGPLTNARWRYATNPQAGPVFRSSNVNHSPAPTYLC